MTTLAQPSAELGAYAPLDLSTSDESRARRLFLVLSIASVALGALVRGFHVFLADFPLNDGALFFEMVEELRRAGFRLPETTSYNDLTLPYAYSPLAFYLTAALAELTGASTLDLLRWLPWLAASGTVWAFHLLARALAPGRVVVIVATVAFALAPRSFMWMIMGGGLTRSFGFLFALLAIHQVHAMYVHRRWANVVGAGVFSGLVLLSHIGTAPFVAATSALLFLFHGRHRFGVVASMAVALVALVVSAPWWAQVVAMHGVEPFLAAGRTGGNILTGGRESFHILMKLARLGHVSSEPLFPLISALGILGIVVAVASLRLFVPLWLLAVLLFDARQGNTFAMAPVALLVGIAIANGIMPLLRAARAHVERRSLHPETADELDDEELDDRAVHADVPPGGRFAAALRHAVPQRLPAALATGAIAYGLLGALTTHPDLGAEGMNLTPLSQEEREAMRWMSENTPIGSRVFVAPQIGWAVDRTQEWFPVLARRASPVTVQGTEWMPDGAFDRARDNHQLAMLCANDAAICLPQLEEAVGTTFTHVYLPRSGRSHCCRSLASSLHERPEWRMVFDGPGALVFERVAPAAPRLPRAIQSREATNAD